MSEATAAETYTLTQRDGNAREVTLENQGRTLLMETPDRVERLSPHRAYYLADVTDALVGSGAILSGATGFIDHLRDFAVENADADPDWEVSDS